MAVIKLMKNSVATDVRYLWNIGTYLKTHVASHPDENNLQHLNYFIQKLFEFLTCRPI
jgi:hypothetical protein